MQLIDLSIPLADDASYEPWKPAFHYLTHEAKGLDWVKNTFGVTEKDLVLSDGKGILPDRKTGQPRSNSPGS